jgi:hypothetical protein
VLVLKKILLFLNVCTYNCVTYFDTEEYKTDPRFQTMRFVDAILLVFNMGILKFIFHADLGSVVVIGILLLPIMVGIFWGRDVKLYADNFNQYYSKYALYLFSLYFIAGIICTGMLFYSVIGK